MWGLLHSACSEQLTRSAIFFILRCLLTKQARCHLDTCIINILQRYLLNNIVKIQFRIIRPSRFFFKIKPSFESLSATHTSKIRGRKVITSQFCPCFIFIFNKTLLNKSSSWNSSYISLILAEYFTGLTLCIL